MLVIKKHFIRPSFQTYIAIGVATFLLTFGILSVVMLQNAKDQPIADSSQPGKKSHSESTDRTTVRTVAYSSGASLPYTSTVNESHQSDATDSEPGTASTTPDTDSGETTTPATASNPSQSAPPQPPVQNDVDIDETQNPSLLSGVVGGLLGAVNSIL